MAVYVLLKTQKELAKDQLITYLTKKIQIEEIIDTYYIDKMKIEVAKILLLLTADESMEIRNTEVAGEIAEKAAEIAKKQLAISEKIIQINDYCAKFFPVAKKIQSESEEEITTNQQNDQGLYATKEDNNNIPFGGVDAFEEQFPNS